MRIDVTNTTATGYIQVKVGTFKLHSSCDEYKLSGRWNFG